jgi:hypothetical protein
VIGRGREATVIKFAKVLLLLIAGVMASCRETATGPETPTPGRFYLEREYVNSAWGYVHRGVFVDTAGVIISYDLSKTGIDWEVSPGELYTEAELWAAIHHNDTVRGVIPTDTLSMLRKLAYDSVSGKMSDTTGSGADMGAVIYSCYTLEGGQGLFRKTELRVGGDCEYHNTSASAIQLANWMASRI